MGQKRDEWVSRIWDLAEKAIVEILKWWLGGKAACGVCAIMPLSRDNDC
jgi:hypothetical protein